MQRRLAAILAADVVGYSRLMGADEMGTHTSLKSHRRDLIDSTIAEHRGRIVKNTGDGMLVEFASVVDAVSCAVNVQRSMVQRNAGIPQDKQIVFRIGINIGDIIIDDDDIFGDGVNIAARLETLCEPGGVCISRSANDQIRDKLSIAFADLGEQAVKNISRAVGVFGLTAKDIEALPDVGRRDISGNGCGRGHPVRTGNPLLPEQGRRAAGLCADRPGSSAGQNRPLDDPSRIRFREPDLAAFLPRIIARPHLLSIRRPRQRTVGSRGTRRQIRKFRRRSRSGCRCGGHRALPLLGISQGCAVSIAYAVRHPERVSHLVLLGGYAVGWKKRARTEAEKEAGAAMLTLMRLGWGQENPSFRQMFTTQFIPGANKELADWFNEFQRISSSPADAARNLLANGEADVSALLSQVKVPTLVMHARNDARVPFELGRRMAAGIPGARFVPLESPNHIMLEGEPALERFLEELKAFIEPKAS